MKSLSTQKDGLCNSRETLTAIGKTERRSMILKKEVKKDFFFGHTMNLMRSSKVKMKAQMYSTPQRAGWGRVVINNKSLALVVLCIWLSFTESDGTRNVGSVSAQTTAMDSTSKNMKKYVQI